MSESDKNLEVQDAGVIGNIESFAWLEPCINSHQFVDSFTSVLMLVELCPDRVRFFGQHIRDSNADSVMGSLQMSPRAVHD